MQYQPHLHSIFQGACQKEEGDRVQEALLPQQREGVLQGRPPPAVLTEVVAEERRHLHVLLGPGHKQNALQTSHPAPTPLNIVARRRDTYR